MRSFSLTWSEGITEKEAIVYVSAVHEALQIAWSQLPPRGNLLPFPEITPFGSWILQGADPEIDYFSFEWYQDRAADPAKGYLRAVRFLDLILDEPWQRDTPHYDLSLVHSPLVGGDGRPTLGLAVR